MCHSIVYVGFGVFTSRYMRERADGRYISVTAARFVVAPGIGGG